MTEEVNMIRVVNSPADPEKGLERELKIQLVGEQTIEEFKQILFRALSAWADAPVEWMELSDKLEHGYILQDYRMQRQRINTVQNPELGTPDYVKRVAELVEKYGIEEWREHLRTQQSQTEWIKMMKLKYPDR